MTKSTYQEAEEATAKLQRAKLSSCQLPTYYAGYKGWLAVREHSQAKLGAAFNLKEFHESGAAAGGGAAAGARASAAVAAAAAFWLKACECRRPGVSGIYWPESVR